MVERDDRGGRDPMAHARCGDAGMYQASKMDPVARGLTLVDSRYLVAVVHVAGSLG